MNLFSVKYAMFAAFIVFYNRTPLIAGELASESKLFLKAIISAHNQTISATVVSPDKSLLVISSWDGTSTVWNCNTGELKHILREKEKSGDVHFITSAAINENNKILTGSSDRCATLWDGITGEKIKTLQGHKDFVVSVAFSNRKDMADPFMVSGSHDGHVIIWDMEGNIKQTLIHQEPIVKILVSEDNSVIVTVTRSTVHVWDAARGIEKYALPDITENDSIPVVLSSEYIILGKKDGKVLMFDMATGGLSKVLYEHSHKVTALAVTPDRELLLSGSFDGTFTISEIKTCSLKCRCGRVNQSRVKSFFISDDNQDVLVEHDFDAALWDISSGKFINRAPNTLSTDIGVLDQEFARLVVRDRSVFIYTQNRKTPNIINNQIDTSDKPLEIAIIAAHNEL